MTPLLPRRRPLAPRRQQGIALIMAIIMLIIATLIGLAGIRNTSLQEKLSANLYDRAIAMQAAEFALSRAEKWLFETERAAIISTSTVIDCTLAGAACPAVPAAFKPDSTNWVSVALPSTFNSSLTAGNPQYFIQYLGLKNSDANISVDDMASTTQYGATGGSGGVLPQNATYRITVRSSAPTADNDRSIVVLTSLVKSN